MRRIAVLASIFAVSTQASAWFFTPHTQEHHEAVVIGSGYGGSVSALRLGEAGIQTVVFEKGRDWSVKAPALKANTFADLESVLVPLLGDSRSSWLSNICFGNIYVNELPFDKPCRINTGILEMNSTESNPHDLSPAIKTENVDVMVGVGVGGGSLINNGITYRPFREGWERSYDLEQYPYMNEIWDDLEETYFDRAEGVLNPSVIPDDILASQYYENVRTHHETMIAAGYPQTDGTDEHRLHGTDLLPMTVDWQAVREEMSYLRTPSIIKGEVWWGTNSGAKNSLDKSGNYLGKAKATGHVDVRPLHTVKSISYDENAQLYTLQIARTDKDYDVRENLTVTTPNLIVSAGSLGTTKLMMAAKNQGGLPDLNEHVGTKWSNNGNTFTLRTVKDSRISQGGPAGSKTTDFDDPDATLVIENLSQKVPQIVSLDPSQSHLVGAVATIAIGVPSGEGQFGWDEANEEVTLTWPKDASKNIYDKFFSIMEELDQFGQHEQLPIEDAQDISVHPLGGMPIGLATDMHCGVKNYPNLYAIDGSVIPGSSALANPALLISSMAERCIDNAVDNILAQQN
jgi:cholesterol oxidase